MSPVSNAGYHRTNLSYLFSISCELYLSSPDLSFEKFETFRYLAGIKIIGGCIDFLIRGFYQGCQVAVATAPLLKSGRRKFLGAVEI
jgi:hypothetical protein